MLSQIRKPPAAGPQVYGDAVRTAAPQAAENNKSPVEPEKIINEFVFARFNKAQCKKLKEISIKIQYALNSPQKLLQTTMNAHAEELIQLKIPFAKAWDYLMYLVGASSYEHAKDNPFYMTETTQKIIVVLDETYANGKAPFEGKGSGIGPQDKVQLEHIFKVYSDFSGVGMSSAAQKLNNEYATEPTEFRVQLAKAGANDLAPLFLSCLGRYPGDCHVVEPYRALEILNKVPSHLKVQFFEICYSLLLKMACGVEGHMKNDEKEKVFIQAVMMKFSDRFTFQRLKVLFEAAAAPKDFSQEKTQVAEEPSQIEEQSGIELSQIEGQFTQQQAPTEAVQCPVIKDAILEHFPRLKMSTRFVPPPVNAKKA